MNEFSLLGSELENYLALKTPAPKPIFPDPRREIHYFFGVMQLKRCHRYWDDAAFSLNEVADSIRDGE